jgi:hypothetical protein
VITIGFGGLTLTRRTVAGEDSVVVSESYIPLFYYFTLRHFNQQRLIDINTNTNFLALDEAERLVLYYNE